MYILLLLSYGLQFFYRNIILLSMTKGSSDSKIKNEEKLRAINYYRFVYQIFSKIIFSKIIDINILL